MRVIAIIIALFVMDSNVMFSFTFEIILYDYRSQHHIRFDFRPTVTTKGIRFKNYPRNMASSLNSNQNNQQNHGTNNKKPLPISYNLLGDTFIDHDKKPCRTTQNTMRCITTSSNSQNRARVSSPSIRLKEWGVILPTSINSTTLRYEELPTCPTSLVSVAQEAFKAISNTLYNKQSYDPNIFTNAMAMSITEKRPVGFAYGGDPTGTRDVGRLGIEIDGLRYFFNEISVTNTHDSQLTSHVDEVTADLETMALCRFSILLAIPLVHEPWEGLEKISPSSHHRREGRDIVIYFNTLKQTLVASQELQSLKRWARDQGYDESPYRRIRILSIQDDIPPDMLVDITKGNKKIVKRNLAYGKVDPTRGVILIVQPSDLNHEFKPPCPVFGSTSLLQRLLARSSIHSLPVVVISPRLTESLNSDQCETTGFDQSGFQKSSTYGGIEPPKGTSPWILRDFIPPVYSYVGCAYRVSRRIHQQEDPMSKENDRSLYDDNNVVQLTRVAITQSICQPGHPWHLFAVNSLRSSSSTSTSSASTRYHYIASTQASSGRPTTSIIQDVLSECKLVKPL